MMEAKTLYLLAADAMLLTHVLVVIFIVAGLALVFAGRLRHWSWIRNAWFRTTHLLAISVVVLQSWSGIVCPLTTWEMALRAKAGDSVYAGSFIAHWLESVLYYQAPAWVFIACYSLFGLLVVASWVLVRPHPWRTQKQRGSA